MAEAQSDSSDEEPTIAEDIVVTKYSMAGEMANRVLQCLLKEAIAGKSVLSLCELGDRLIVEETGKVFKKEKEMKKGIAFPTCVSVNNCICHFSPLRSDLDVVLSDGDVVKIDLGIHIDGFIAAIAHTVVVGMSPGLSVCLINVFVYLLYFYVNLLGNEGGRSEGRLYYGCIPCIRTGTSISKTRRREFNCNRCNSESCRVISMQTH
jgi:methionine aminopeptidase